LSIGIGLVENAPVSKGSGEIHLGYTARYSMGGTVDLIGKRRHALRKPQQIFVASFRFSDALKLLKNLF
jgi:hypothetical protein